MDLNDKPHRSWADVYDLATEKTFNLAIGLMTSQTVQVILDRLEAPASIVDFGAGTGRISIPLAEKGFNVTAVEPCQEMLDQLSKKEWNGNGSIQTIKSNMESFEGDGKYDAATCVFTVLLYLIDEQSQARSLHAAYHSLKPGGIFLIDIPRPALFHGYTFCDELIERSVDIIQENGNLYTYHEDIKVGEPGGKMCCYKEEFPVRYWPRNFVVQLLEGYGFTLDTDLSFEFYFTGSDYLLFRKTA
jgi:SAM-dependent methyltransferase